MWDTWRTERENNKPSVPCLSRGTRLDMKERMVGNNIFPKMPAAITETPNHDHWNAKPWLLKRQLPPLKHQTTIIETPKYHH